MDQAIRTKLRTVVTQCRKLLEDAISQELEGKYGIFAKKDQVTADPHAATPHLNEEEQAARRDILDHFGHIKAGAFKPKDALDQLIREIAFTHLNRLCAYKMMEAREVYVGGQKFREAVSRGVNSNGVKFYLAEHPDDERLFNSGHQDLAYRHFLDWLGGLLSDEIGVLFSPNDPANRLHPRQKTLDEVLALLNHGGIKPDEADLREAWSQIWSQDETIGWVYQYFTPKELREKARKESQAPRNSYELAFRNQLFTPRYVVEFLTDNTLGRIWYEMRLGKTRLKDQCRYMVRRPDEVFLAPNTTEEHRQDDKGSGTFAKLLQTATPDTFPPFDSEDDGSIQRMIAMAHCVSAFDQFGENVWDWYEDMRPRVEDDRASLVDLSTADLFHYLFITCRNDRQGGSGAIDKGKWFVNAANEIRRRVLSGRTDDASQEDLLKAPLFIPHRPKKDPRELRILDPACGSGHFLLYCFDLLLTIYEEAYSDADLGPALQRDYPTLDDLRRDVPRLILANNLHGIDIDLRASQIAALALWLRCQRAYQDMGLKQDRPRITRSNVVCAEPMPGETQMLKEFVDQLEPRVLGQVVEVVFDKMKLAGEAGSLLKIEEEIRDALAAARQQWNRETAPAMDRRGQPLLFSQAALDRLDGRPEQGSLFDLSDVTDTQFFEQAESKVINALRRYAESAQNGYRLQRRLFSEDAVRGFSFVDLCQNRYDVVLMNPPFGLFPEKLYSWAQTNYAGGHNDIYAAFLLRACSTLSPNGTAGVISSNSFLRGKQQEVLRRSVLQQNLTLVCDLGLGVMDDAWVESAAYIISRSASISIVFLDVREDPIKEDTIIDLVTTETSATGKLFVHSRIAFGSTPRSAFLYDMDSEQLQLVGSGESFDPVVCTARSGLRTFDNERFIRLWWECPTSEIGHDRRWVFFCKGGEFELFYQPLTLVVHWGPDGHDLMEKNREVNGQIAQARQGSSLYFRKGITFTSRSELGFCARLFPEGCIFSSNGPVIIPNNDVDLMLLAGLFNSSRIRELIDAQSHRRSYSPGLIRRINWIALPRKTETHVAVAAEDAIHAKFKFYTGDETCPEYMSLPYLVNASPPKSLNSLSASAAADLSRTRNAVNFALNTIDDALSPIYGDAKPGKHSDRLNPTWGTDVLSATNQLMSYVVGCSFGRWDIRFEVVSVRSSDRNDPASGLPSQSCATLKIHEPVGSTHRIEGYPIRIATEGILTDDFENDEDLVRRVREVIEFYWKEDAVAIETEACDILEIRDLRDYFRKPGKGGFWDDHITRYSKSRRKAPIYWLLQSSKRNYAIWLYYHRLDKDILAKALVNYVEPKIRLETTRLETLLSAKAAAGESSKDAKRLAKDAERQEDFLSELRDFEDKLRRVANLHLDPDLNDGVVLNIAPLHELVPWKEAKKYWDELLAGKYEWSSIGKQLREKGLVS